MTDSLLGTKAVTQIGILVHDIRKTSKIFQDILGIEPRMVVTDPLEKAQTQYLGKPSKARAQLAFFTVGPNLEIELIEPDKEPSTWRHDLDANGEGVHHIAFEVAGIKKVIANLAGKGMSLLQTGEYTGGRYAYVDANDKLKVVLELLEHD